MTEAGRTRAAGDVAGSAGAAEAALREALEAEEVARRAAERADADWRAAALRVVAARAGAREAALAVLARRAERDRLTAAREAHDMAAAAERLEGGSGLPWAGGLRPPVPDRPARQRRELRVWDPVVRLFHWSVAAAFLANGFVTEPGKAVHVWLGYGVAALVLLRIVWGFVGSRHARFADFLPTPAALHEQMSDMARWRRRPHAGHSPLGALMIFNLLATLAAIAASGHAMTTVRYFGVQWVADLHEGLVIWAQISVGLHVLAVVVESRRLGVNLVRAMVTGVKRLP